MRIEPPASVPSASGKSPSATAAALPPEEPPALRLVSKGLRVGPNSELSQVPRRPITGRVGLADEDGAGLLDPLGEGAVELRDVVLQRPHAAEGGRPARLEVEQVLDRRRHAVQRAERLAAHDGLLGAFACLAARIVEIREDQGIEARIARSMRAIVASITSTGDSSRRAILSARSQALA